MKFTDYLDYLILNYHHFSVEEPRRIILGTSFFTTLVHEMEVIAVTGRLPAGKHLRYRGYQVEETFKEPYSIKIES